jgi:tryptophan halogenase
MQSSPVRKIVIVGGGTAGWMSAAAFSRFLDDGQRTITLVESEQIGTIGVGEATIPPIREFNQRIGIDEKEFLAASGATFKLAVEFVGWGTKDETYLHPFGDLGQDFEGVSFHQYWLKHRLGRIEDYFLSAQLARRNKFVHPSTDPRSPVGRLIYAYHFDAGLYAAFLRKFAEARGVSRVEGKIARPMLDPETGHVRSVELDDGRSIEGDLFIDCSGFRSLLLGKALGVGFHDWRRWLPCDRAVAVPSARSAPLTPFTRATALEAGWQWRIPLQHRTGSGLVYSSAFWNEDEAERVLVANLDGKPLEQPLHIRIDNGVRHKLWDRNVVAIGLSGGFIEPLESTGIHLIQTAITKLLWLFPDRGFNPALRDQYNKLMVEQYEYIRDFITLHYHANQRDEPFWREMQAMALPDSLAEKLELFGAGGRIRRYDHDLFGVTSWAAVLPGQNVEAEGYDPLVDSMDQGKVKAAMAHIAETWREIAERAPDHADAVAELCRGLATPPLEG